MRDIAKKVQLAAGALFISNPVGGFSRLDELCGYASRLNPKRGYLFVSKVLGKHIPVKPSVMRQSYRDLADKIMPELVSATDALFLGFAETATGLAAGVFEACTERAPAVPMVYVQTTRYRFDAPCALEFQEQHSHATGHLVFEPTKGRETFFGTKTLVIVDDELSTGRTCANFLKEFRTVNQNIEKVVVVSLLNWMSLAARQELVEALPGCEVAFISLLDGTFAFKADDSIPPMVLPPVDGNQDMKDAVVPVSFGRFGETSASLSFNCALVAETLNLDKARPVHIVGDGEYLFPPFKLAEYLETQGYDVYFQSTTRSPILLGDAISSKDCFWDHYGDGIVNFAYNLPVEGVAQVVLCVESTAELGLTAVCTARTVTHQELTCV